MDVAAGDADPPVVVVHKDGVAAQLIELAVGDLAIFRTVEQHRAATIDRPVASQQRLFHIHERACRMAKGEALQRHGSDGFLAAALKLDQMPQPDDFDRRLVHVDIRRRIEVQRRSLGVVEPLAGSIQFLEDVLHKAVSCVHAHLAVVLPAAFVGDFVLARSCP